MRAMSAGKPVDLADSLPFAVGPIPATLVAPPKIDFPLRT